MASIGRPLFLLFILVHTASAAPEIQPGVKPLFSIYPKLIKSMAKKLMINCMNMGYQVPVVMQNISKQIDGKEKGLPDSQNLLAEFFSTLTSLPEPDESNSEQLGNLPLAREYLNKTMWNYSNLPAMVKMMRKSSKAHACFMQAFLAPFSWEILMGGKDMNSEDYDSIVWAAKPLLQNMPPSDITLPHTLTRSKLERMMILLKEVFGSLSERQRSQIKDWVRQQVPQIYFNCTLKPKPVRTRPEPAAGVSDRCPRKLMWLKSEVMMMMGPYLSRLTLMELDTASHDQLCEFFMSQALSSSFRGVARMNPVLARRFLDRIQNCTKGLEFSQQMERMQQRYKPAQSLPLGNYFSRPMAGLGRLIPTTYIRLGILACYYEDNPPVNMTLKAHLLTQLNDCDNSGAKKLKKRLVKEQMASKQQPKLSILGSSVTMLSTDELSSFPTADLKKILKSLGPKLEWNLGQSKRLVQLLWQEMADVNADVDAEFLILVGSAVKGIQIFNLMNLEPNEILNNDRLENVTKKMTKGQKMAVIEGLSKKVNASELIKKLPVHLLSALSLNLLKKANLTSLDQVEGKQLTKAQAALVCNMTDISTWNKPQVIRWIGSTIQGMTCRMMDRVAEKDSLELADALTENSQWLSKTQVTCAARKLFATLESKRYKYFKNITEQELDKIPPLMLIYLQPEKIEDMPDHVCTVFLTKMSVANLSALCLMSLSRPALTKRALRCLTNGRNMSAISSEEMLYLGQLLCEVPPSELRRLSPEALNSSLQAMAACPHIPPRHHLPLLRLLKENYGNVSDWSKKTMEYLSPFLLLYESEIEDLHSKPWLKKVLSDLEDNVMQSSTGSTAGHKALKKKLSALNIQPDSARRRRADISTIIKPTVQLVEDMREGIVFLNKQLLHHMSAETFKLTVEIMGSVTDYSKDQLTVLTKKALEAFGPVSLLNESVVIQLGCVNQGFSDADLQRLPVSLETLQELSKCSWLQAQREAIWKGVSSRSNLTADMLGAAEIVALDQFICGLNAEDIGKLQQEAFRNAVSSVGDMQCPLSVTKEFTKLAVTVFGAASQLTEADVSTLGNIVAGLNALELSSLDPSVLPFLSEDSIPLIPVNVFSALSTTWLKALGPDNGFKVTAEQKASLSAEKMAALQEMLTGSRATETSTQPPVAQTNSGAPSPTIEGIAAFMKPFLFLFLGFLLL